MSPNFNGNILGTYNLVFVYGYIVSRKYEKSMKRQKKFFGDTKMRVVTPW